MMKCTKLTKLKYICIESCSMGQMTFNMKLKVYQVWLFSTLLYDKQDVFVKHK